MTPASDGGISLRALICIVLVFSGCASGSSDDAGSSVASTDGAVSSSTLASLVVTAAEGFDFEPYDSIADLGDASSIVVVGEVTEVESLGFDRRR